MIAEKLKMKHLNIGSIIQQNDCHDGYDTELESHVLDEDKLIDVLENYFDSEEDNDENDDMGESNSGDCTGGIVADYHACELFPERWFDLILVLRANTHILYDRLVQRGYSEKKRTQNMECEIMQIILEEAKESYAVEIVQEVQSNTLEDIDSNVSRVQMWYTQWVQDHAT